MRKYIFIEFNLFLYSFLHKWWTCMLIDSIYITRIVKTSILMVCRAVVWLYAKYASRRRFGMIKTLPNFNLFWRLVLSNRITIFKRLTCFVDNFIIKHVDRMSNAFTILFLYLQIRHSLLILLTRYPTDSAGRSNLGFGTSTWSDILEIYFGVIVENFSKGAEGLRHLWFYRLIRPLSFHLLQCLLYFHYFLNKRNILKTKLIIEFEKQSLLKELNQFVN